MIKIAVMCSGGGTNLQALLDSDNPYGEIVLVIGSRGGIYALERARLAGIKTLIVSPRHHPESFAQRLLDTLRAHQVELIVLAGYLSILPAEVIQAYQQRILNVHPALLPAFGGKGYYGLKVHEAALARGVKITGATVHFVNEEPDGGKIILQRAVNVLPDDTPESLQRRVMEEAEWVILPAVVNIFCEQLCKWHERQGGDK